MNCNPGNWLFIPILFFFLPYNLRAQKREILAQDLLEMIQKSEGDTFKLRDARIVTNDVSGYRFLSSLMMNMFPAIVKQNLDTVHIYKLLDLKNVEFGWDFTFQNFYFHNWCGWKIETTTDSTSTAARLTVRFL